MLVITLEKPPLRCQAELTPGLGLSTQATIRQHCLYLALKPISGHAQSGLYHTLTINGIYVHSCHGKIQEPNSRSPVRILHWQRRFVPSVEMQLSNWERGTLWNYATVPKHFWKEFASLKLASRELFKEERGKEGASLVTKIFSSTLKFHFISKQNQQIFIYILYKSIHG